MLSKTHAAIAVAAMTFAISARAEAASINPVYINTFEDATTFQNRFTGTDGKWHWTIDPGADSFPDDFYERPVMAGFRPYVDQASGQTKFATDDDYFGYLDITAARAGFDQQYLYVAIDLHDTNRYKSNQQVEETGLVAEYRVRISNNADGSGGFLFNVESPFQNQSDLISAGQDPYSWVTTRNFVYQDIDNDLAVDGITPDLEPDNGSGYETEIVNDGNFKSGFGSGTPFFSRISPDGNDNIVEFAIAYEDFGFTQEDLLDLPYLVFESNRGNSSTENPDKYLLNHRFSPTIAGSPYPGSNGLSEYGTQGLVDIKEMDTLNGGSIGAVPEPSSILGTGVAFGLGCFLHRKRKQQ